MKFKIFKNSNYRMDFRQQFLIDYTWVQKVIESCTHSKHTRVSLKLIDILKKKYKDKLDSEYLDLFISELKNKWQQKEIIVL